MQIQSVSADCLKKRKKLEVLTTIQFSLHLSFALLSLSPPLCHPVLLIVDIVSVSVHVCPHCSLV